MQINREARDDCEPLAPPKSRGHLRRIAAFDAEYQALSTIDGNRHERAENTGFELKRLCWVQLLTLSHGARSRRVPVSIRGGGLNST